MQLAGIVFGCLIWYTVAAQVSWKDPTQSGQWENPKNWVFAQVPLPTDDVVISYNPQYPITITLNGTVKANTLIVQPIQYYACVSQGVTLAAGISQSSLNILGSFQGNGVAIQVNTFADNVQLVGDCPTYISNANIVVAALSGTSVVGNVQVTSSQNSWTVNGIAGFTFNRTQWISLNDAPFVFVNRGLVQFAGGGLFNFELENFETVKFVDIHEYAIDLVKNHGNVMAPCAALEMSRGVFMDNGTFYLEGTTVNVLDSGQFTIQGGTVEIYSGFCRRSGFRFPTRISSEIRGQLIHNRGSLRISRKQANDVTSLRLIGTYYQSVDADTTFDLTGAWALPTSFPLIDGSAPTYVDNSQWFEMKGTVKVVYDNNLYVPQGTQFVVADHFSTINFVPKPLQGGDIYGDGENITIGSYELRPTTSGPTALVAMPLYDIQIVSSEPEFLDDVVTFKFSLVLKDNTLATQVPVTFTETSHEILAQHAVSDEEGVVSVSFHVTPDKGDEAQKISFVISYDPCLEEACSRPVAYTYEPPSGDSYSLNWLQISLSFFFGAVVALIVVVACLVHQSVKQSKPLLMQETDRDVEEGEEGESHQGVEEKDIDYDSDEEEGDEEELQLTRTPKQQQS